MPFLVASEVRSSVVSLVTKTAKASATMLVRISVMSDIPRKLQGSAGTWRALTSVASDADCYIATTYCLPS